MAENQFNSPTTPVYQERTVSQQPKTWSQRYGTRHRLEWIKEFPPGIVGPKKVRIYRRASHFVLQWWDKAEKRNLCERVDGDLVVAISRARQIDERMEHFRASGGGPRKAQHEVLIERFQADLHHRADAGEIDLRTVRRYEAALKHYRGFIDQPHVRRQYPHISPADREFALGLAAYLRARPVAANGHEHAPTRPMQRPDYVLDVVRAMYDWAADPQRGKLIPEGFHNPFLRRSRSTSTPAVISIGEPDITVAMACEFIAACDAYQLHLFVPLVLYGLRAAEPCFLFHEHIDQEWLRVPCLPGLDYLTKGRREKHLPMIPAIAPLLKAAPTGEAAGLLYLRRDVLDGPKKLLVGTPLDGLVREFQRRCGAAGIRTAVDRRRARDRLLHDAGGISYGHIASEFDKLARALRWPRSATPKDFRHLFATGLENAGMPEHYRKFLLGQSPGRAAVVTYTHLNEIRQRFEEAVERQFQPLIDAIVRRASELR